MPLDGILLNNLCKELQPACGCRVDKISLPSRDELVISLRSVGFSKKLFVSARPGSARIHFTNASFENPAVPPMLCMLFRKYLSGSKVISVSQEGFERIITVTFLASDEMGELRELKLITELIGNQSNIILVGADGRIIDSVRRSDIENATRLIQPGAVYEPPLSLNKYGVSDPQIIDKIMSLSSRPLSGAILDTVAGFSPLTAREVAFLADPNDTLVGELDNGRKTKLISVIEEVKAYCQNGVPHLISDENGLPRDFSYMPIHQYGERYRSTAFDSFSSLLDSFYSERDRIGRLHHSTADVFKTLSNIAARTEKKLHLRKQELKKCADRENFRIYGELIKANIHQIERGATFAEVPNYYDENLSTIRIPLDPALSPASNSARYFKEYRKLCSAEQTLGRLIEDCERERDYIKSVNDALSRADTLAEILDIKDELIGTGYIKRQKTKAAKRQKLKPKEYTSSDGYRILAGRNNSQNDELTLRTAAKDDIWLHTKKIHGSHVVILCGGTTPPDTTIIEAAQIAAYNSQARNSSQVPVDYTKIKYVKKPSGARPGMVIYTTNNTVFVTPKEF